MAELKSIEYREQNVSLLFGARWYRNAKNKLKFETFDEVLDRITDLDVEYLANLFLIAHENACFYKKTDPIIKDIDDALFLIDEIKTLKACMLINESIIELSGYNDLTENEKKELAKKRENETKKKIT